MAGSGPGQAPAPVPGPGTPIPQNSFTPPAVPASFASPSHPGPAGGPFSVSPGPGGGSPFQGHPSGPATSLPLPNLSGGPGPPLQNGTPAFSPLPPFGGPPGPPPGPIGPTAAHAMPGPHGPPHGPPMGFPGPFPPHLGPPLGPQHLGPPGMLVPGGPMGPLPMGPERLDHGRPTPYFNQPDYRIHELNKRLQQKSEESDSLWWDAFATEFFEDDATLTLTFCLEDGPKRYTIGRTLIPRYFRSIYEGGVTDLFFGLRHHKESFHTTSITLDCDLATMVTHHGKPMIAKVCAEGRFIVEFTFDDLMRIRSWHFATRSVRELVPRSLVALHLQQDPALAEQLSKNITRQGLTNVTLNYLRLCVILEPMQELMTRHKVYSLSPRDCLKTTLFQKWQRMVAPPAESQRPSSKRRKRKSTAGGAAGGNKKGRSPINLTGQVSDVMMVGEPTLMGGDFGDEDERLITRLENAQCDPAVVAGDGPSLLEEANFTPSPLPLTTGASWPPTATAERAMPTPQVSTPNSQDSGKKSPVVA